MPLILGLAVLLDVLFGEPSNRWHPVAWIGRALGRARQRAPKGGTVALLCGGALAVLCASLLVALLVHLLVRWTSALGWVGLLIQAWLLKYTFSVKGLALAARQVQTALVHGHLEDARRRVGWHLVSRPTEGLSSGHVASAAVESVAENFTDSVVAPPFFFLLFGLPGAWMYRVVNTADAMWGYREGQLEHFGKPAARLDDLLNWIPARLAGVGIGLGALAAGEAAGNAWRTMVRDHRRTASPNAGWTMAAMAGALGVALEKPGTYRLGGGPLPGAECIDRAVRVMLNATGVAFAMSLAVAFVRR